MSKSVSRPEFSGTRAARIEDEDRAADDVPPPAANDNGNRDTAVRIDAAVLASRRWPALMISASIGGRRASGKQTGTERTAGVGFAQDFRREFVCPEESMRYAGSLEQLVLSRIRKSNASSVIVEFGSGTGEPVISAILNSGFTGVVHGYEINPEAAEIAEQLIDQYGLAKQYIVHNISFYESKRIPQAEYLIANPPYLPC